jgi:SH3 domain-containing YSC84-like protein 1
MRSIALTLAVSLGCMHLVAASTKDKQKNEERLTDSVDLFTEVMGTPDKAIPQDLLEKAHCIVIVPGLKKAAFVLGGKFGRGFALCRNAAGGQGWGPPAAIRIEGGGIGFQIGVSSTDVILLVMNERGMKKLASSKFTLGGDATAAGPVGRNASAQTDAFMSAEILSWSRSKGLFAGVSLDGATLRTDLDENQIMYGQRWNTKEILGSGAKPPAAASKLMSELNKYSPREQK